MKRIIPFFLLWMCCMVSIQAQDFRISKFKENMLDLSAASSGIKDRNGDACAIIKFSSRDDKFVFEPNMGVIKQEKKVGETWLYIPASTKRITIRHPQLGMLRDYSIPVVIEQKMVYEAEIEITNKEYLRSLLETKTRTDTVRIVQRQDTIIYREKERHFHAVLGLGFNVVGVMGPTAFLGFQLKSHSLEAGTTVGMGKVQGVSLYQTDNSAYWGTYDYKPLRIFARYGYDVNAGALVITPQAGVAFNNINGAEMRRSASGMNLFGKAHVVSATLACRIGYSLGKAVRLQLTPEFDLGIKKSKGYDYLKEVDSKIKSWGTGVSLSAGVAFYM